MRHENMGKLKLVLLSGAIALIVVATPFLLESLSLDPPAAFIAPLVPGLLFTAFLERFGLPVFDAGGDFTWVAAGITYLVSWLLLAMVSAATAAIVRAARTRRAA
jgi:hypothetical protein